jgi:hypothetical protein
LFALLASACSSQKETALSTGMQNLTARFNVLYNARELLEMSEKNIEAAHIDDYAEILPVYKEPTEASSNTEAKLLDSVAEKANIILDEKGRSKYTDDAYFLKGKITYFKRNFFNASEFFDYLYANYPEERELRQAALVWKARAQLQLDNLPGAAIALDTALKYVGNAKPVAADVYATSAQLYIRSGHQHA